MPNDGEWTITWTVTNNSNAAVDIDATAGGVSPSGYDDVAPGQSKTFTKVVDEDGDYQASFEATWDVNGQKDTASATAVTRGQVRQARAQDHGDRF